MAKSTPTLANSENGAPPAPGGKLQIYWAHVVCAVLGFGASFYALVVHNRLKAGASSACGISESCDTVIGSEKWGQFAGIPLGVFGMAYFIVVLMLAFSAADKMKTTAFQRLAVALGGAVGSLGLEYVMWVIIKAGCPVCISIHVVTWINFAFALALWLKLRRTAAG